ncbi:MAG: hypothetical protein ACTSRW_07775 [Candidatus Helarchaeota archaeon]
MIRNVFIIMNHICMVNRNFGQCQSLGNDPQLISGFLGAIDTFASEVANQSMKSIEFGELKLHFYKHSKNVELLVVLVTDLNEKQDLIQYKLEKIASIFIEQYADHIENFKGDVEIFENFGDILIEMKLAQKNCGGRPECDGCPNSGNTSKILNAFKKGKRGFISRIRSYFKRSPK